MVFRKHKPESSICARAKLWAESQNKRQSIGAWATLAALLTLLVATWWVTEILHQKSQLHAAVVESGGRVYVDYIGPEWMCKKAHSTPVVFTQYDGIWWIHANDQDLADLQNYPLLTWKFTVIRLRDGRLLNMSHYTDAQRERWRTEKVTDEGIRHLSGLTRLKVLDLRDTSISNDGLLHLLALRSLEYLDLSETNVTDEGLRHLSDFKYLKELRLCSVRVTGLGFESLESLPNLQKIVLADSSIDNQGLLALSNITSLTQVNVVRTKVTDQGVAEFKKLRPDCRVDR